MSNLLKAEKRETNKKSVLTGLREKGNFPAVVYGYKTDNTAVSVNESEFFKVLKEVGRNGVISIQIGKDKINVILGDYQHDRIKNIITHADFLAIDMSSEITAEVNIHLVGDPAGSKDGGVVQQTLHQLSVTAKPNDIPESIEVDVTELNIGDSLTVGDIRKNTDAVINNEDEDSIVSVQPPKVFEESEKDEAGTESEEENTDQEDTKGA
jgi:large subunit ribosomal protein L25